jgi:hypothetical protein
MVPELRPRGIGEMLDTAVAVYRARLRRVFLTSLLVVVPVQALITLLLISAEPTTAIRVDQNGTFQVTTQSQNAQLGAGLGAILLFILASLTVTALVSRPLADAYVGYEPASSTPRLAIARRGPFAIVGLVVMLTVLTAIGLVICIIPALLLFTMWAVAIPVLVLEGGGAFQAMGRSRRLVASRYGATMGLVATAWLLSSILNYGINIASNLLVLHGTSRTSALLAQGTASALVLSVTEPVIAAALVVCYFDLRIRSEAFDVQLMMQRNDQRYALAT